MKRNRFIYIPHETFTIHNVFSLMMFSPRMYSVLHKRSEISTCSQRAVNSCAVSSRLQSHLNNTHRLATPSPLQPTNQERVRVSRAHKALTGKQVKKPSSGEFELCEKTDFLSRFRESAVENRQRTELIETWDLMYDIKFAIFIRYVFCDNKLTTRSTVT